ncbi:flagellar hook-associated protein FlgK [Trinickia violacea]|uniref:Flagellar hook-associated protein 1 n=1 Tax=Trinickia violacea TaxID=2571746 RepID=A0A4P8IJ49_9BURK|nr:flagellar hook-associated protein FlgK [Trinickia violacea]QCP47801.1 flagellar hook-associated protein FlgK [Trinickia violacea]
MSNNIFNIGLSGLQAAQWGMTTTSQNISNASTPGYDVESAVFAEANGQYTGSGYMGNGVSTATTQRAYSQYLTTQLNNATATNSSLTANNTMASQLNNLVGSPTGGISAAITAYFTGLQSVSNNPSSLATRQTAISDAQSLADQINTAGQQYDSLRQSVNQQLSTTVTQINTYSTQIAQLNTQIQAASAQGQPPNQLMDQRDQVVSSLSQLVGVSVVQNSSGYSLFLGDGQPLVVANQSFSLSAVTSPSNPSETAIAYNGIAGSSSPSTDYLPSTALTGGTLGGLTSFVSQTLDPAEAQLGAIATSFASQVNAQNSLGLTLSGSTGGNLFTVAGPTVYANKNNTGAETLSVTLTNPSAPPTDNYSLAYNGTNYTLTDTSTNTVVSSTTTAPTTVAGMTLTLSGAMTAGDSFTIQPTSGALNSFALATTSASAIAAQSPALASATSSNTGTATIGAATVSSGYSLASTITLTYNSATGTLSGVPIGSSVSINSGAASTNTTGTVAYTSGNSISINGVAFTISGTPANGDTFKIAPNTGGTNDGSNALAMSNLVSNSVLSNGTATLTGAYANYVNNIGNAASTLQSASKTQSALVTQITSAQQSVSGVNLDEEASHLMQYQQLYQANSKVIQTANSMFQTLLGIFQ